MKCTAKAKGTGQQCRRDAMRGQRVCQMHGGAAGAARRAGARRVAEAKATVALQRQGAKPIGNPLEALQALAAEVVTVKDFLGSRVEVLQELRYRGIGGEEIRGELVAYERALDRCIRVLGEVARLNIDERLASITVEQARKQAEVTEHIEAVLVNWLLPPPYDNLARRLRRHAIEVLLAAVDAHLAGRPEKSDGLSSLPVDLAGEVREMRAVFAQARRVPGLERQVADLEAALVRVQGRAPLAIEAAKPSVSVEDVLAGEVGCADEGPAVVIADEPLVPDEVLRPSSGRGRAGSFPVSFHVGDGYDD